MISYLALLIRQTTALNSCMDNEVAVCIGAFKIINLMRMVHLIIMKTNVPVAPCSSNFAVQDDRVSSEKLFNCFIHIMAY